MHNTTLAPHFFTQRLVQFGLANQQQVQTFVIQAQVKQVSLIQYLIGERLVDLKLLAVLLAQDFELRLVDLNDVDLGFIQSEWLNPRWLDVHGLLPLWQEGEKIWVAVADPTDQVGLDLIKFSTGFTPECVIVAADQLQTAIKKLLAEQTTIIPPIIADDAAVPAIKIDDDAPIIRYVNKILLDAVQKNASDIHFETYENHYRIRFRIDGILHEFARPPFNLANRIATRLKILAHLNIAERRLPQDGRFKFTLPNQNILDVRVSSCPTVHGEKIVLRLLNSNNTALTIENLGLDVSQQQLFLNAIHKPQGMILVTGPTGSGKTVTLYTALNHLNSDAVNILTIEDPVEIYLSGINQVNIHPKANLTFAAALRAFLRQDPDVIMIGEMRDQETAEIAIKAAQTGHLVLSTLHTNSAIATLTRLTNLGISAYNIAASTQLIIAQRLVRRLCDQCKFISNDFYEAHGCAQCMQGYKGRIAIFEILPMTEQVCELLMRGGTALALLQCAIEAGMVSLRESGLNKVKQGLTSLAEINRVTCSDTGCQPALA